MTVRYQGADAPRHVHLREDRPMSALPPSANADTGPDDGHAM